MNSLGFFIQTPFLSLFLTERDCGKPPFGNLFSCPYRNTASGSDKITPCRQTTELKIPIVDIRLRGRAISAFVSFLTLCSHRIARSKVEHLLDVVNHTIEHPLNTHLDPTSKCKPVHFLAGT